MWDIGRGSVTTAIDVIKGEAGEPSGEYEGAYGAVLTYVWGAELGTPVSTEKIRQAPFSAAMPRDLACGDYLPSTVEFYSYGERVWP